MKKENKIRIERLERMLVHLTEAENQGNGSHNDVDNFYICYMYKDMFKQDRVNTFDIDYPEAIYISRDAHMCGAWLTDDGFTNDKAKRKIKILSLHFLIQFIK